MKINDVNDLIICLENDFKRSQKELAESKELLISAFNDICKEYSEREERLTKQYIKTLEAIKNMNRNIIN